MTKKLLLVIFVLGVGVGLWFLASRNPAPNVVARQAVGTPLVITVGDNPIKAYTSGRGPNVILVPSAGREASDFNELVSRLNVAGYSTMAIDPHGVNGSNLLVDPTLTDLAAPILAALRSSQEPSVLIGHAFGNRVVRAAAHSNPENVNAVILLAAGGYNEIEPKTEAALKNVFNPLSAYKTRMKDVAYAFFADGNEIPPHWQRGWHTKTAMMQGKAKTKMKDPTWEAAGGVPMLVVQALEDRIAPKVDTTDLLVRNFPTQVSVALVPNAGHALLPEQPEAIGDAILDYLNEHHSVASAQ